MSYEDMDIYDDSDNDVDSRYPHEVYELFEECFPEFPMTEEIFLRLLDIDNCPMVTTNFAGGKLVGCGVVKDNCIRLLCVHPDFRGCGIGKDLLRWCETYIRVKHYDKVVLGGDSELFIGEVVQDDTRGSFFERQGYTDRGGCIEMKMSLADFRYDELVIPPCPRDVTFGYIDLSDKEELFSAVQAVDPEWLRYFTFSSPIYAAKRDGKIVGFCIVDEHNHTIISTGENNVGMIGCVGVIPEARRQGVGLAMVANATENLRRDGCDDAFIHYTNLEQWYGRLVYKTFLRYRFGEKELA